MGYYTRYTLTQERNLVSPATFAALIAGNEEASYALSSDGSSTGEESKWYRNEEDMCGFSQREPMVLFKLHGEGEEAGDIWDKYFAGGKKVHEVRLVAELPKPDYDVLVPYLGNNLRKFVMDVPIIAEAYSAEEAHGLILSLLSAAKVEFDSTCIGDAKAEPLD